jgi:hypothetical protein
MGSEIPVPPGYIPPPQPPPKKKRTKLYVGILLIILVVAVIASISVYFWISSVLQAFRPREVLIDVFVESNTVWSGVIYKQDETIPIQIASGNQTLGYVLSGGGQLYFGLQLKKATDFGYLKVTVYDSSETDPETGKAKVLGIDETTEPYGMVTLSITV